MPLKRKDLLWRRYLDGDFVRRHITMSTTRYDVLPRYELHGGTCAFLFFFSLQRGRVHQVHQLILQNTPSADRRSYAIGQKPSTVSRRDVARDCITESERILHFNAPPANHRGSLLMSCRDNRDLRLSLVRSLKNCQVLWGL